MFLFNPPQRFMILHFCCFFILCRVFWLQSILTYHSQWRALHPNYSRFRKRKSKQRWESPMNRFTPHVPFPILKREGTRGRCSLTPLCFSSHTFLRIHYSSHLGISIWPPRKNLYLPIPQLLSHLGSQYWCLNIHLWGQGIQLYH